MLGQRIVRPSLSRTPAYDSVRPETREYSFSCSNCGGAVVLDLASSDASTTGDERILGAAYASSIRDHFEFNLVGKSHDGGWPELRLQNCAKCGARYLIYLGVREPSNGHVLITVQGITQWTPDAPAV